MENRCRIFTLLILFTSCGKQTTYPVLDSLDSTKISHSRTTDSLADLFVDSNFTFLNVDSLEEEMLRDSSITRDYKYIKSVKRFAKRHCDFFRAGCSNTFFDDHVFLVSKQRKIGQILPVIIHNSRDFNYYHSDLYTLDKDYKKVDSMTVSLTGSGIQSDEPSIYYKTMIYSRFEEDKITTTKTERWRYPEGDSTVTKDSTIVYSRIESSGKIKILRTEKIL